ncbi:MAG: hypothetical protein WCT04_26950, partial [Planctomycetota bacterium]
MNFNVTARRGHGFNVETSAIIAARMCSGIVVQIAASAFKSSKFFVAIGVASFVAWASSGLISLAEPWREILQFRASLCASLQFWPETKQGTPFSEVPC